MTKRPKPESSKHSTAPRSRPARATPESAASTRSEAPFAVASDGTLLINVSSLEGCDFEGRELFIGAKLTASERRTAFKRISHAAHELQSLIGGRLLKPRTANTPEK